MTSRLDSDILKRKNSNLKVTFQKENTSEDDDDDFYPYINDTDIYWSDRGTRKIQPSQHLKK